jgi:hypothetical protein
MEIKAEDLAYWFFRLNGFLLLNNFVIHAERKGTTGTDVDILGVRFPYRAELFEDPMADYAEFKRITKRPYVAIVEVKRGMCDLNGPWTDPDKFIFNRLLHAVGIVPFEEINNVSDHLLSDGCSINIHCYVSLVCLGEFENKKISSKYPLVRQILWVDVKTFIYERFKNYQKQKSWHQTWDINGQNLWDYFKECRTKEDFISGVEVKSRERQV